MKNRPRVRYSKLIFFLPIIIIILGFSNMNEYESMNSSEMLSLRKDILENMTEDEKEYFAQLLFFSIEEDILSGNKKGLGIVKIGNLSDYSSINDILDKLVSMKVPYFFLVLKSPSKKYSNRLNNKIDNTNLNTFEDQIKFLSKILAQKRIEDIKRFEGYPFLGLYIEESGELFMNSIITDLPCLDMSPCNEDCIESLCKALGIDPYEDCEICFVLSLALFFYMCTSKCGCGTVPYYSIINNEITILNIFLLILPIILLLFMLLLRRKVYKKF